MLLKKSKLKLNKSGSIYQSIKKYFLITVQLQVIGVYFIYDNFLQLIQGIIRKNGNHYPLDSSARSSYVTKLEEVCFSMFTPSLFLCIFLQVVLMSAIF